MNNKTRKIFSIALDAFLLVLIAAIMFVSISTIVSHNKGYVSYFGNVMYVAKTSSMDGDKPDSFAKNTLILSKELKTDSEKMNLKIGDVITFRTIIGGQAALNTHRIVGIIDEGGVNQQYVTRGDHPAAGNDSPTHYKEVVAKFTGKKINGIGAVVLFAQTSSGFFVLVMIPSLLILGYCAFLFYTSIKKINDEKKQKAEEANKEAEMDAVREAMRKELLAEMEAKTPSNSQQETARQNAEEENVKEEVTKAESEEKKTKPKTVKKKD